MSMKQQIISLKGKYQKKINIKNRTYYFLMNWLLVKTLIEAY